MITKLKKIFSSNDEVDTSRRKFIRNAGALAALTAVAIAAPSLLTIKTIEDQIASGIIENQTFYIDKTIVIDIPNVIIRNCKFIAMGPMDCVIEFGPNAVKTTMTDCIIDGRNITDWGVRIHPQGDNDMTTTFQSAIDCVSDGGTIYLTEGTCHVNCPTTSSNDFVISGEERNKISTIGAGDFKLKTNFVKNRWG